MGTAGTRAYTFIPLTDTYSRTGAASAETVVLEMWCPPYMRVIADNSRTRPFVVPTFLSFFPKNGLRPLSFELDREIAADLEMKLEGPAQPDDKGGTALVTLNTGTNGWGLGWDIPRRGVQCRCCDLGAYACFDTGFSVGAGDG